MVCELYLNKVVKINWRCLDWSPDLADSKAHTVHKAALPPQEVFEKRTAVIRGAAMITPQREEFMDLNSSHHISE
jgi:hypothetical protein